MKVGIWEVTESLDFFLTNLPLSVTEQEELALLPAARKLEWLATRYILHITEGSAQRRITSKTSTGKPYFNDYSDHISLSHSHGWTAAIVATKSCGIDIQKMVPKIHRIASKFLSEQELSALPANQKEGLLYLHAIWGAKEALYKAYGARELDFKEHIYIQPFELSIEEFSMEGEVRKNGLNRKYTLFCSQIQDFILVYGMEQ